jgi:hypothetical protein
MLKNMFCLRLNQKMYLLNRFSSFTATRIKETRTGEITQ